MKIGQPLADILHICSAEDTVGFRPIAGGENDRLFHAGPLGKAAQGTDDDIGAEIDLLPNNDRRGFVVDTNCEQGHLNFLVP